MCVCALGEEGVAGINRINRAGTRRGGNQMAGKCFENGGDVLWDLTDPCLLIQGRGLSTGP